MSRCPAEVRRDGSVVPPLNITKPAPALNLKGFKWTSLEPEPINRPIIQTDDELSSTGSDDKPVLVEAQPSTEVKLMVADEQTSTEQQPLAAEDKPQRSLAFETPGRPKGSVNDPGPDLFPISQFRGTYAGNGFNLIFRPRANTPDPQPDPTHGPADNILELNLTTEQLTFGDSLGSIPNRGLLNQPVIFLGGIPYLQTIQDVTDEKTGTPTSLVKRDIHFEPGVWLMVPKSNFAPASVTRMASIPHGTTINAQGITPEKSTGTELGGFPGGPRFDPIDTHPFLLDPPNTVFPTSVFRNMDATQPNDLRIPRDLGAFVRTGFITSDIIQNPNLVLSKANEGLNIVETLVFHVATGPPTAALNGGGTANIAFLAGKQDGITTAAPGGKDNPNAHAAFIESTFWVERVEYPVTLPALPGDVTVEVQATMPAGSTAPTPVFAITTPPGGVQDTTEIKVRGTQIQYNQIVRLNFGPQPPNGPGVLTWPHVSVATLVPSAPQEFKMT